MASSQVSRFALSHSAGMTLEDRELPMRPWGDPLRDDIGRQLEVALATNPLDATDLPDAQRKADSIAREIVAGSFQRLTETEEIDAPASTHPPLTASGSTTGDRRHHTRGAAGPFG